MLDLGTEGSVSTIYPDAPRFWELHLFFFFFGMLVVHEVMDTTLSIC